MKIIAIILSVYISALTLVPCVDNHISDKGSLTELCQKSNDSDMPDVDLCSPLCTCNCCGTSISFEQSVFFESLTIVPSALKFYFRISVLTEIALSFWQPPKIS